VDTGLNTQVGGRVKRLAEFIGKQPFMLTYGDGVANLDLKDLLAFHRDQGKLATVTAVRPPARFGNLTLSGDLVSRFEEKPQGGEGWINGGYFVLEPGIVDYITGDETVFEHEPLEELARQGQLSAYQHEGFWQCLDTVRDMRMLEYLWQNDQAPWKVWQ
jgi:glucose-1-phosphate cytidylyltransferase